LTKNEIGYREKRTIMELATRIAANTAMKNVMGTDKIVTAKVVSMNESAADDKGKGYWTWEHPPHVQGYPVHDGDGVFVGYIQSMIMARRICAGMNQLKDFRTPDLESSVTIITRLLHRTIKLQNLVRKHIYMYAKQLEKQVCRECLRQEGIKHDNKANCSVLNPE
jgi:hypothetical protein